MCYSAESSIKNYAIGIAPLIPLFIYGNKFDKHFVFVIFCYSNSIVRIFYVDRSKMWNYK